jgi:ABC-2 type transport system permease protein
VLLAGLAGGRFAIAAFQAVYIVAVTAVAFGVDWGDPLTTTLLILIYSILSAAAGMVLGSLFRNDSQATGAGIGIGLVFAALGGSMMALEFFPEGMRRVAMLTPHGWANTAMAEIVRRDGTITDVAIELGVLAAMAVGLLVLATWLLRRAITR